MAPKLAKRPNPKTPLRIPTHPHDTKACALRQPSGRCPHEGARRIDGTRKMRRARARAIVRQLRREVRA